MNPAPFHPFPEAHPDVWRRVQAIIAAVYCMEPAEITPQTHFVRDLSDSWGFTEVVLDCEQQFGLALPDEFAMQLVTVGQLAASISRILHPDYPPPDSTVLHPDYPPPDSTVWPPPPKRPGLL